MNKLNIIPKIAIEGWKNEVNVGNCQAQKALPYTYNDPFNFGEKKKSLL